MSEQFRQHIGKRPCGSRAVPTFRQFRQKNETIQKIFCRVQVGTNTWRFGVRVKCILEKKRDFLFYKKFSPKNLMHLKRILFFSKKNLKIYIYRCKICMQLIYILRTLVHQT